MSDLERDLSLSLQSGVNPNISTHTPETECKVYRCYQGCGRLHTLWEMRIYGGCPRCGQHKANGAYPHGFEWIRIWWWNFFKRWQVHGPEGYGWNVQQLKATQHRAILQRRQEQGL